MMIETAFELGINLIETLMTIDFITRYLGCKYEGKTKIAGFLGAWLVSFIELSIINYIVPFEGVAVVIPMLINFTYALIFLKGRVLIKLWVSALAEIILLMIAIGTNLFICNVIKYDPSNMITVFNGVRVIGVIITKILDFYVYRLILRYRYKNPLDVKSWVMLIIIPVISVVSISALMVAVMQYEQSQGYILCGMTGIVAANVITYYLFVMLNKDHETKLRVKLLEQQNKNAQKSLEDADIFVKEMRSVRHDIKNQLMMIQNYISSGKINEANDHIEKLTNSYMPEMQAMINTDNEAFDAIVNSKIAICNSKKIYIEVKEFKNSISKLDKIDTVILFGNLLDNAIEAAEKTDSRRITVDVQTKGAYLSILVTNSIAGSVLETNKELETDKENKALHGIGIKSIKNVVEKYNGMIQFYEESNEFCCHILLDLDED